MKQLLTNIKNCTTCQHVLKDGVNPIVSTSKTASILIIGQAPGIRVHKSGTPWDDSSGKNLRSWLNIDSETFYDNSKIAMIPMGFCYPGKGTSGDLPPRKECAPQWHSLLLEQMKNIKLTLLIGQYAQAYYLSSEKKKNLTDTVQHYQEYLPNYFPLPHPSPRNNIWQKKNPWFKEELLPVLKNRITSALR